MATRRTASSSTADESITPTADETVFSSASTAADETPAEPPADTPTEEPTPEPTPEPEPEPEPVDPALALLGKVVTFHEQDEWGNPRVRVGILVGEHTWMPGKYEVARLPRDGKGYDLADLSPLPADGRPLDS